MAPQICALNDAAWAQDRQGRDGAATGDSVVLDVARGARLRATEKVRFARRTARTSRWCSVEHRVIDWASCSSLGTEEFEVVIMIAVADRRDAWVGLSPDLNDYGASLRLA